MKREQADKNYWQSLLAACDVLPEGLQGAGRQFVREAQELRATFKQRYFAAADLCKAANKDWRSEFFVLGKKTESDSWVILPEDSQHKAFQAELIPLMHALHKAHTTFHLDWIGGERICLSRHKELSDCFFQKRERFFPGEFETINEHRSVFAKSLEKAVSTLEIELRDARQWCFVDQIKNMTSWGIVDAVVNSYNDDVTAALERYIEAHNEAAEQVNSELCTIAADSRFFQLLTAARRKYDEQSAKARS